MIEKLLMIVIPQALERWRAILAGIGFFTTTAIERSGMHMYPGN
jgi:hypothetical protein